MKTHILNPYEAIALLSETAPEKRYALACQLHNPIDELSNFLYLLPENTRLLFAEQHINSIQNPYSFFCVVRELLPKDRLNFCIKYYSKLFNKEKRSADEALYMILEQLNEDDRLPFAKQHRDEILKFTYLGQILKRLKHNDRLSFAILMLDQNVTGSSIDWVLECLPESERLEYFKKSQCMFLCGAEYLKAIQLVPVDQKQKFREINFERISKEMPFYEEMVLTLETIDRESKDEKEKSSTYSALAVALSNRSSIDIKPFNPAENSKHVYIRTVESKLVSSTANSLFSQLKISDLITQYSGHYFDPERNKQKNEEAKKLSINKISWQDLIFLHKNKLGLRAVPHEDCAYNEFFHGGHGDTISLSNFGMHSKSSSDEITLFIDEEKLDLTKPGLKQQLLTNFHDGIVSHINSSFSGLFPAYALVYMELSISPYDFHRYPLGKSGKKYFSSDDVKAIITRNDLEDWSVESIYHHIITAIKRLSKTLGDTAMLRLSNSRV